VLVILGLMLFVQGLQMGLFPIGDAMAVALARKGSVTWLLLFSFALGASTTIAEPALIAITGEAAESAAGAGVIGEGPGARERYAGLLRHDENGTQPDHWQVNAYFKSFWYGFPWRDRVLTRIGLGSGLSYAERVPTIEARDQARRGEDTNKLITYLDPPIDVSLGDLIGSRALKRTFVGLGVSHRSGIFGLSRLLGNVDGGSNYIYTYVEFGI